MPGGELSCVDSGPVLPEEQRLQQRRIFDGAEGRRTDIKGGGFGSVQTRDARSGSGVHLVGADAWTSPSHRLQEDERRSYLPVELPSAAISLATGPENSPLLRFAVTQLSDSV